MKSAGKKPAQDLYRELLMQDDDEETALSKSNPVYTSVNRIRNDDNTKKKKAFKLLVIILLSLSIIAILVYVLINVVFKDKHSDTKSEHHTTLPPTIEPTFEPIFRPTNEPTTIQPTLQPTIEPTFEPIFRPTSEPTLQPSVEPTFEPTVEPTFEPTLEPTFQPIWNELPKPAIPFIFEHSNMTQNMTLNANTTYFDPDATISCIIEFDKNGKLNTNKSYIQMLDTVGSRIKVDMILISAAPLWEYLPINCTVIPAVKILEIINDTYSNILTLHIRTANMFEYIDELDCNITNGTIYDIGIDYGEAHRVKNITDYFSNTSTIVNSNGTAINITFTNITYTESEAVCYNVSENGTIINIIPMINGICDGMSVVDYFGQSKGIDAINFGNTTVNGNDTQYGIAYNDDSYNTPSRRRLGLKKFFKKVKNKVKKIVKTVEDIANDVIDILKGDIHKRILDVPLSFDASVTQSYYADTILQMGPLTVQICQDVDGMTICGAQGFVEMTYGADFYSSFYVDLAAKYKIFSSKPSFDLFKLTLGGEIRLKTWFKVESNGTISLEWEVKRIHKTYVFAIGPIPVVVEIYGALSIGIEFEDPLDFVLEWGFATAPFSHSVEWSKDDGKWKTFNEPLVFKPFKNFASDSFPICEKKAISPFVTLEIGVILYEFVGLSIPLEFHLTPVIEFPSSCNSINQCDNTPYLSKFSLWFQFKVFLQLAVGILGTEAKEIFGYSELSLPEIDISVEVLSLSVDLFDVCWPVPQLSAPCCNMSLFTTIYEMSFDDASIDWNIDFGTINTKLSSPNCPLDSDICWELQAPSQTSTHIETIGYHDIQILIDINSIGTNHLCWITYGTNSTNDKLEYLAKNGDGPFINKRLILFGNVCNDAPSLNIQLGAGGGSGNACYFDNMRVIGEKI
eukprot:83516_1